MEVAKMLTRQNAEALTVVASIFFVQFMGLKSQVAADCCLSATYTQPVWLSTYFGLTVHYTLLILLYMHSVQSCVEIVRVSHTHFSPQGLIIRYISSWHAAGSQPLQRQHQPAISTQVDIRLLNLPPLRNHKTLETLYMNDVTEHTLHTTSFSQTQICLFAVRCYIMCVLFLQKQHTPGEDIAGTVVVWSHGTITLWVGGVGTV